MRKHKFSETSDSKHNDERYLLSNTDIASLPDLSNTNVKSITLNTISFDRGDMYDLLSRNCPQIESIQFINCDFSSFLQRPTTCYSKHNLAKFSFINCTGLEYYTATSLFSSREIGDVSISFDNCDIAQRAVQELMINSRINNLDLEFKQCPNISTAQSIKNIIITSKPEMNINKIHIEPRYFTRENKRGFEDLQSSDFIKRCQTEIKYGGESYSR